MSRELGVADIFVKDESYPFGLNAFKVLGGSYAIGRYVAKMTGRDISETGFDNIAREGADVTIEEVNYDDCVRLQPRRPAKPRTAWSSRIPPGRAARRSPPGSCRATAPWLPRLLSS